MYGSLKPLESDMTKAKDLPKAPVYSAMGRGSEYLANLLKELEKENGA